MILRAAREEVLEKRRKPDMIMYSLLINGLFQGNKIRSNLVNRSRRRRRFHMLVDEEMYTRLLGSVLKLNQPVYGGLEAFSSLRTEIRSYTLIFMMLQAIKGYSL
jgi:hypothetical protein